MENLIHVSVSGCPANFLIGRLTFLGFRYTLACILHSRAGNLYGRMMMHKLMLMDTNHADNISSTEFTYFTNHFSPVLRGFLLSPLDEGMLLPQQSKELYYLLKHLLDQRSLLGCTKEFHEYLGWFMQCLLYSYEKERILYWS